MACSPVTIFDDLADRVEYGRHDDPTSALDSVLASLTHLASASRDRGLDSSALDELLRWVRDAAQTGYGKDEISRIVDTMWRPQPDHAEPAMGTLPR
ncbi:imine reductase family protein [Prauserella aidingensis]|uniref:imine reductase family protein n=1 Tax=Prauserella aidingensis TaxID=387890 RepID=UPI0020A3361B|nr:hypothetical protein [Prauserella aidingensis]